MLAGMANMSYCRFHNTLSALRDCAQALEDDDLSNDEKRARAVLIKVCREIVEAADFNPDLEARS